MDPLSPLSKGRCTPVSPYPGRGTPVRFPATYKVYKRRFWVLAVFCHISCLQGMIMMTFAPILRSARAALPYLDQGALDLLMSWPSIMAILFTPCVSWLISRREGLWITAFVASLLCTICCIMRVVLFDPQDTNFLTVLNVAHILNGIAGIFILIPSSFLSAQWFPPSQGVRATACCLMSNNIGQALGFVLGPYMIQYVDLYGLFIVHATYACMLFLLVVAYFPSRPPTPPTLVAADCKEPALMETASNFYSLLCNRSFLILCVVCGWVSGAFLAWMSLLGDLLSRNPSPITDEATGFLSFCSVIGFLCGGAISSYVVDRLLPWRQTEILSVCCTISCILSFAFFMLCPYQFKQKATIPNAIFLVSFLLGIPAGASDPLMYEYGAQLTYPVPEGASAAFLALSENFGSMIFFAVLARRNPPMINAIFMVGVGICAWLAASLPKYYGRSLAQEEAELHRVGSQDGGFAHFGHPSDENLPLLSRSSTPDPGIHEAQSNHKMYASLHTNQPPTFFMAATSSHAPREGEGPSSSSFSSTPPTYRLPESNVALDTPSSMGSSSRGPPLQTLFGEDSMAEIPIYPLAHAARADLGTPPSESSSSLSGPPIQGLTRQHLTGSPPVFSIGSVAKDFQ